MDIYSLWDKVLVEFELNLSKNHFDTWFKNTCPVRQDGSVLVVSVPNEFVREWVANNYSKEILKITKSTNPDINEVNFIVITNKKEEPEPEPVSKKIDQVSESTQTLPLNQLPLTSGTYNPNHLNPKYTLSSLIVGTFNEIAYSAGQAIIKKPGTYNPFYVYGSTGTGKTHLVQSIGNELKTIYPDIKIHYVSADSFSTEFINAIGNKTTDELRDRYISYDVLIMDDVQFLSNRDKTQEQLFHIFNTLTEQGKQILFTSDKHPQQIIGLEDRIKSRLTAGMVVDITKPDFESRLAILKSKSETYHTNFTPEVLQFIAQQIDSNIRELEGIFNTISVQQDIRGRLLTVNDVKEIIKNHIKPKKSVSIEEIIKTIAHYYHIEESALYDTSRRREIVQARQVAMYFLRSDYNISYPLIGRKLGGKDHTTVMHSYEKIREELTHNTILSQDIDHIRSILATL